MYMQGKCIRRKYLTLNSIALLHNRPLVGRAPSIGIISPLLGRVVVRPKIDFNKCRTGLPDDLGGL
jgi:hypothetical protein